MKYGITGHTSGIGKELYNKLNSIGFSRSNGFDIRDKTHRAQIINDVVNCDVFINNAESNYGQTELLVDYWKQYHNHNKTIINIGSAIGQPDVILPEHMIIELMDYHMQKTVLRTTCEKLQSYNSKLKVKYIWFGYVGTDRILKKYPHFTESDYITLDAAVKIILDE